MKTASTPAQGAMASSMMQAAKMEASEVAVMGGCFSKELANSRTTPPALIQHGRHGDCVQVRVKGRVSGLRRAAPVRHMTGTGA